MKISIHKTGKPLNHRVLTVIYLICFLLGFCIQGYGEATQTIHRTERVQYTWKLYDNLQHWYRTWRVFNGKTQGKEKKAQGITEVPEPQPSPSQAGFEIQRRGRCNRQQPQQHLVAQNLPARRLAHALWRQDARRGYPTTHANPSGKGTMQRPPGALSAGGSA